MDWCTREWNAGLGFLAEKYNFTVQNYDDRTLGHGPAADLFYGPSGHAVSFKARVLWLSEGDSHAEWLHEVAHLVCAPPWEKNPNDANEFGGIFGWERAVAKEFTRRGLWTDVDFKTFEEMQDIYSVGDTPPEWNTKDYPYGPAEWGGVPSKDQAKIVAFINKTLRMVGLLNGSNRPTFAKPKWVNKAKDRWDAVLNFKVGWPEISKSSSARPR